MRIEWFLRSMLLSKLMLAALLFAGTSDAQTGNLQRFSITPIPPPSEGVAVFRDHPDKAGIIIESPITNLTFSSNMDGIVDQRSEPGRGRYVLIIEPFTQIIVVDAPGYIQGRFRVGNPVARDVLYYEIEAEESAPDLISVIFNVRPEDALLYVDDQQTETNRTVQLPPGLAELRLEREGYRIIEDVVTISPDNILFNFVMEQIDIVPVNISSNVTGARVVIDGTERGKIDRSGGFGLFLYPGTYALSVNSSGYVTHNETLEVTEEGDNRFTVDLQRNIGELALDLTPSDATVKLNRQDYSGQDLVELAPGRYRLDVQKQGYAPHSESFEIVRNERLERNITLEAYTGSLQFTVSPSNAKARLIDDSGRILQHWEGVNLIRGLKVGSYTLIVKAAGYQSSEQFLLISKDETLKHQVELLEGFQCGSIITDIDGNEYRTVQIGDQCWMVENLRVNRYQDGSEIPFALSGSEWRELSSEDWSHYDHEENQWVEKRRDVWTHYDYNDEYNNLYGKLYNWFAVDDLRGLCPKGWHIPSDKDWELLINHLGGRNTAGGKLKASGPKYWNPPNQGATNESGFSGLPGGHLVIADIFSGIGRGGYWWSSSSEDMFFFNRVWRLRYDSERITSTDELESSGFSVRCLRE